MSSSQGTQTVAACCHINSLPTETLTSIFHYLDISDIISCCRACRRWRNIISYSESIWRSLCATLTDSYLLVESDRRKGILLEGDLSP
ncbi:hypothetical protein DPMN_090722 [Dreissena polymorpha]|uniref:F-box domain-containing protein n=1 Tax=Dreissena polymorpha TaxID=45954 RepID=A0A9D4KYL8_DREPO|nr:hypothetical protein DPMN_090722 [Dreissena polymorpha]